MPTPLLQNPAVRQFLKFAIVGCLNVAISTMVFYLCYTKWRLGSSLSIDSLGITELDGAIASVIAYSAGMINSYLLNKSWTFRVKNGTLTQVQRFFILNMAGLALTTVIIFVCVDMLNGPYMTVWFITVIFVMALNFLGNKYWTFIEHQP